MTTTGIDPAPFTDADRLDLYRYITADKPADYLAIMRLFSSTTST